MFRQERLVLSLDTPLISFKSKLICVRLVFKSILKSIPFMFFDDWSNDAGIPSVRIPLG